MCLLCTLDCHSSFQSFCKQSSWFISTSSSPRHHGLYLYRLLSWVWCRGDKGVSGLGCVCFAHLTVTILSKAFVSNLYGLYLYRPYLIVTDGLYQTPSTGLRQSSITEICSSLGDRTTALISRWDEQSILLFSKSSP